jgi:hypothetical protein
VTVRRRAVLELVVAALAAAGAVLSWCASRSEVVVAPVMEGEPSTTSIAHHPPLLALALILATVAGVLTVLAIARLRKKDVSPYTP